MRKPTKTQIKNSNAVSFQQLLEEIIQQYPNVEDIYYSDHEGVWCIKYKAEKSYSEHDSFAEVIFVLAATSGQIKVLGKSPLLFKAIPVEECLPEIGKWVTTIDTANEHRVYRLMDHGWNMRDADGINSPNNNLAITHWLEQISDIE